MQSFRCTRSAARRFTRIWTTWIAEYLGAGFRRASSESLTPSARVRLVSRKGNQNGAENEWGDGDERDSGSCENDQYDVSCDAAPHL
jgi:hypothetical protein